MKKKIKYNYEFLSQIAQSQKNIFQIYIAVLHKKIFSTVILLF